MFYLALRRNVQPRSEWTVTLDEHLAWMKQQHDAGVILLSGPSADRSLGMYLIRAGSLSEAEHIAQSDPFTAAGHCAADVIEWQIHQIMGIGSFTTAALQGTR